MLATVPAPTVRRSGEILAAEHHCPYCRGELAREAKKCRWCGEWVVSTSGGIAAAALHLVGLLWAGLTVLAVAALWAAGQGVRRWVWLHAVDTAVTPRLVDMALYGLIALVLLGGLMASTVLWLLARLSPRRPSWWA